MELFARRQNPKTDSLFSFPSQRFLLQHWERVQTDEGETYFWHTLTGATQWEKPAIEYSQSSGREALRSFELAEIPNDADIYTGPESRV